MSREKAPENTAMVADFEVEEFVHDDIILKGAGFIEQIGGEGAATARRAGSPLPRHSLDTHLLRRYANTVRPVAHPLSKLVP
jgi:hypothetical protein